MFGGKGGRHTEWIDRETKPVPIFSSEVDNVCIGQHSGSKEDIEKVWKLILKADKQ